MTVGNSIIPEFALYVHRYHVIAYLDFSNGMMQCPSEAFNIKQYAISILEIHEYSDNIHYYLTSNWASFPDI